MNTLKENGLSIPEDVSVIGCNDIMLAEFMNPLGKHRAIFNS